MGEYEIKLYWQLTDAELGNIWFRGMVCGALPLMARDIQEMTPELFSLFARRVEVFGSIYTPDGVNVGLFYLTDFEGSTAQIHFCLFEAGRKDRLAIGREVLDWCFKTFEFQAVVGIVPSINQGAARFARECGGREMGIIPGHCWIARLKRAVGGHQFLFLPIGEV